MNAIESHAGSLPRGEALNPQEVEFVERWVPILYGAALRGSCRKTRRGAIVLRQGKLVGRGGVKCPPGCWPDCQQVTDAPGDPEGHAEAQALHSAGELAAGATMIYLKFDVAGNPVPSKRRACLTCMAGMRDAGICELILLHDDGWWRYPLGPAPCRSMMPLDSYAAFEVSHDQPILFLDIDGVLNGHDWDSQAKSNLIRRECVFWLNEIIAKIKPDVVLISAWRYQILLGATTLLGFCYMLQSHGVTSDMRLVGCTRLDDLQRLSPPPTEVDPHERSKQVLAWLEANQIEADRSILVLDDDALGYREAGLPWVQPEKDRGLTEVEAQQAIEILRRAREQETITRKLPRK